MINIDGLMLPPLKPRAPTPLYHQLFTELLTQIQSGALPHGFKIPSEAILAEKLDVSRITIKRALDELAAKSLVMRRRGRGTVVTLNTALPVRGGYDALLENVANLRINTEINLLSRQEVPASESTAAGLGVEPQSPVDEVRHRLIHKRLPLSYSVTTTPLSITSKLADRKFEEQSISILLEQAGIQVARAEQRLSAVLATEETAEILAVKAGGPLLEIYCQMIDYDETPVAEITTLYCPDRFQYRMALLASERAN